ncbi:MAG: hypothetical protein AAB393_14350, partial [Bacteroidota bacterium]
MKSFGLTLLILGFVPSVGEAQAIEWMRAYGGIRDDLGSSVQQTSDGGFIVAGSTRSGGSADNNIYLLRLTSNGDTLWTRSYGSPFPYDDVCNALVIAPDGGYVLAGSSTSPEGKDVNVVKTDSNGTIVWNHYYGTYLNDEAFSISLTNDSGYVLTGYTTETTSGDVDLYIVRKNARGDTLWTKSIRRPGYDAGYSIIQARDGGFFITGTTSGGIFSAASFLRTDSAGNIRWMRLAGGGEGASARDAVQANDGGFVCVWMSYDPYPSLYLSQFDSIGSERRRVIFGSFMSGSAITKTSDGGYMI